MRREKRNGIDGGQEWLELGGGSLLYSTLLYSDGGGRLREYGCRRASMCAEEEELTISDDGPAAASHSLSRPM